MALILKQIIQFIAFWEFVHCGSELYKSYSFIDGEIVLITWPMTNSSKTEWVKYDTAGPLIATYDNIKGTVTYGTQWAGDVNITNDGRRYHMSLRVHYKRDYGDIRCIAVDGAKFDLMAIYNLKINKAPVINYLIKDTVRVLSDILLLTENEVVKLVLVVAHIWNPYYVNWMVGDEDVTQVGTNSESLTLELLVTKDMHEKNLKVIIRNRAGTATIEKHIHVPAAPFFVHTPLEKTLNPGVANVLYIVFYSIPRFTKYQWFRDNVTFPTTAVTSYILDSNVTIPLFGKFVEIGGYTAVLVLWGGNDSVGVYTLTLDNGYGLIRTSVNIKYDKDGGDGGGCGGCEGCCATRGGTRDGIGGAGCNQTVAESSVCVTWQPIHMIVVGVIGGLFLITVIALVVVLVRASRSDNNKTVVKENGSHDVTSTGYRSNTSSGYHSNARSGTQANTQSGYHSNARSGYHSDMPSDMSPSGNSADYITPISDTGYLEMRDIHGDSDQSPQGAENGYEAPAGQYSPKHKLHYDDLRPRVDYNNVTQPEYNNPDYTNGNVPSQVYAEPAVSHAMPEPRTDESVGDDPAYHYLP